MTPRVPGMHFTVFAPGQVDLAKAKLRAFYYGRIITQHIDITSFTTYGGLSYDVVRCQGERL